MIKRILWALLFGLTLSSSLWAAEAVELKPLVNFDTDFTDIRQMFTDILKEYWLWLLSFFVVWFVLESAKTFLDGKAERYRAEVEREKRITDKINRAEEKQEVKRRLREREIERSGLADELEREYASREMQRMVGNLEQKEIFVDGEGKRYEIVRLELGNTSDVQYVPLSSDYQQTYESKVSTSELQDSSGYWKDYPEKSSDSDLKKYDPLDEPLVMPEDEEETTLDYEVDDDGLWQSHSVNTDEWYEEQEELDRLEREKEWKRKERARRIQRSWDRDDNDGYTGY